MTKRAYYKNAYRVMIGGVPIRFPMKLTAGMKKLMRSKLVKDPNQLEFKEIMDQQEIGRPPWQ